MHEIYPRRYFDESKTWFAWNKLTAADVYTLREEPGFEGQNVFFHLNNPIRLVRIVGLIVQINSVAEGKYTLLTIDDSSGANIEVKLQRRDRQPGDDAEYPSNTLIDNVDVMVNLGEPTIYVDRKPVSLGSVVRAQGELTSFRNQRQIDLKKLFRVKDTNEEAVHWSKAAEWKRTVLNKPWVLTQEQRDVADEKLRQEERKEHERRRKRRKMQNEHDEKHIQREARREARRMAEQEKMDAGALAGSERLPQPWD
ncbi:hypothetical protein PRZ48_006674 [Zasmidium cellare]|uniref:CST complex subunit STN1 n=1 Tax=Zasmidium cellare TaxID=395010 RepID=A0ABR0EPQ7_ZASCE|nr:hypothetical protein PRZ48_006674 [Zasmidium cellare]